MAAIANLIPDYIVNANNLLTDEQCAFYKDNGFLVIKNLVSKENLSRYVERFRQLCVGEASIAGMDIMKDIAADRPEYVPGKKAIAKIQGFQDDEVLFEYCCLPEILKYVESIIGTNIMAMHTMFINKPPDSGSKTTRHPMHQDLHYFPFRPAEKIVCSWTPIVKVNRENGCLVVIPGSHKRPLQPHGYPNWANGVNKMYHGILNYEIEDSLIHLDMEPGDTVFFHPLLFHGSGKNSTSQFRKSISCHFASSNCHYIDLKDTSQENIAQEIRDIAKKKLIKLFGETSAQEQDISIQEIWGIRAKLVKGVLANL
ncbi:phytanoyl-CoA dioxygenase, peroxisomal-like [Argonauta hians]